MYNDFLNTHLNIHEFHEVIWDNIPEELISNMYLDANDDFIKSLVFDIYKEYISEKLTIDMCVKLLHTFFVNMFKYKPDLSNIMNNEFI